MCSAKLLRIDCSDFFSDYRRSILLFSCEKLKFISDVLLKLSKAFSIDCSELGMVLNHREHDPLFLINDTKLEYLHEWRIQFYDNAYLPLKLVRLVAAAKPQASLMDAGRSTPEMVEELSESNSKDSDHASKRIKIDQKSFSSIDAETNYHKDKALEHQYLYDKQPSDNTTSVESSSPIVSSKHSFNEPPENNFSQPRDDEGITNKIGSIFDITVGDVVCNPEKNVEFPPSLPSSISRSTQDTDTTAAARNQLVQEEDEDETAIVTRIHRKRKRRHRKKATVTRPEPLLLTKPILPPLKPTSNNSKHIRFPSDQSDDSEEDQVSIGAEKSATYSNGSKVGMEEVISSYTGSSTYSKQVDLAKSNFSSPSVTQNCLSTSTPRDLPLLNTASDIIINKKYEANDSNIQPADSVILSSSTFSLSSSQKESCADHSKDRHDLSVLFSLKGSASPPVFKKINTKRDQYKNVSKIYTNNLTPIPNNIIDGDEKEEDFTAFPSLVYMPKKGSLIAFKKLELDQSYQPVLSEYKKAVVISAENGKFVVRLLGPKQQKPKSGKFEMPIEETDFALDNDIEEYNFNELLSPLLLKAAADDALEEGEIFN
ncbi:uncharacterized protein LOC136040105 [Artemia franciscana]|uniref:Coilin tudor domain-containing protein n=1 Tax=Artemia franciscana TaxID=6661 RepID=A0AA88L2Z6_ARTSF|nr:hypothetical protein QYM36_008987 [Artemia franciscana]